MTACPRSVHRCLHVLRSKCLTLRSVSTLLLFLQFDHLFLCSLELFQERGECFHDLLAYRLQMVLSDIQSVDAVWTGIADLETFARTLDPVNDLS